MNSYYSADLLLIAIFGFGIISLLLVSTNRPYFGSKEFFMIILMNSFMIPPPSIPAYGIP